MRISRRKFLIGTGAGVGTLAVGGAVLKALADGDLPWFLRHPTPHGDRDPIWHLLNRAGFGPAPGQMLAVKAMGADAWLKQQFAPASIDDSATDALLVPYTTLTMTPFQMINIPANGPDPYGELNVATELRAISSQRQLFEVMALFWSEHFSIWHGKDNCYLFKTQDDQTVVRAHALGNFRDLLGASAHSPAMLDFLDNETSDKDHPNENYAREIMELHTLSPGHYTEQDVKELARCLTGWTYNQDGSDPNFGTFVFDPTIHDDGAKAVLGQSIAAGGGQQDVETMLNVLAAHPACARFICTKLCRRFISDTPPASIVAAAAQTFAQTHGDIRAVLHTICASDEFIAAPPKFRRPFEQLVALMRVFDVQMPAGQQAPRDFDYTLYTLGHEPFNHTMPDGYKDVATYWRTNLLPRWNAVINLIYSYLLTNVTVDPLGVAQSYGATTPRQILDYFTLQCIGRKLTSSENDTLWNFVTKNGTPDLTTDDGKGRMLDAIALIAASPAAQYR